MYCLVFWLMWAVDMLADHLIKQLWYVVAGRRHNFLERSHS